MLYDIFQNMASATFQIDVQLECARGENARVVLAGRPVSVSRL